MYPPIVGILVNDSLHRGISSGKTKYEAINLYVEAGRKYGFSPCFFRLSDLRAGRSTVNAYVMQNQRYVQQRVPVPRVIHNRAIIQGNRLNRQLSVLLGGDRQLFNCRNRYGKLSIHRLLMEAADLRVHLPETQRATSTSLIQMMKKYDSLIVKPDNSSIGRGIMRIDRKANGWMLTYPASLGFRNRKWHTLEWKGSRLPAILRKRIQRTFYIVQKRVPLATYQGAPFDLRVSVQRAGDGRWQITGIVAKVAPKHKFVTNVAQGGKTHLLHTILTEEYAHLMPEDVVSRIHDFSLRLASLLSERLPHMADLGLDIGITAEGNIMFIECNGKDQRYSFRDAGMQEEWAATYDNPMAYAKYLLDGGIKS